ncbi:MAG: Lrp/AsnC family transcriptional regulator [Roseicyclus sp.]
MRHERVDLDALDRAIVNALQAPLPLVPRPYAVLAERLGLDEADLLARLEGLLGRGVATRFGPFVDAEAMRGAFCLCALAGPAKRFDEVAEAVKRQPEVVHNYARDHALNMWFVLATETPEGIAEAARRIEATTGPEVLCFPKERIFALEFKVAA